MPASDTQNWIKLDRTMSPVQASVRLVREMRESGRTDVTSLSIGAESQMPSTDTEIGRMLTATFTCSPDYNSLVGGAPHVRASIAGWIGRFIGLPATQSNTFLMQTNGRDLMNHAFHCAAFRHLEARKSPAMLLPDTSWPMVNESARDAHLREIYYTLTRDNFAHNVFAAAEEIPSGDLAAIYTNSPHNPTGICTPAHEMAAMVKMLDHHNDLTGDRVMHVIDNPYFSGCDQNEQTPYMKSGYEGVIESDSVTPWIAVISFSKAFGTAQPGLSAMVVHNDLASKVSARLSRNNGLSYAPAFFENAANIFNERNDKDARRHFAGLRDKYRANRASALEILSQYLTIVEGDASMTCLFSVPDDLMGRNVNGFTINDVNDLVEYMGNETGVVVVNNSVPGRNLIRIALRETPGVMRDALEKLRGGLENIMNAKTVTQPAQ
jgi:aspartate/methionine/tyrosine aminotransferase